MSSGGGGGDSAAPREPAQAAREDVDDGEDGDERDEEEEDSDDESSDADSMVDLLERLVLGGSAQLRPLPTEPLLTSFDVAGVAAYIKSGAARRIVVMAGAGISVNAGIPDFRTPGSGLYDNLAKYKLPRPEAVFSIDYFEQSPDAFYLLAKELSPGGYCPTATHAFLRLLHAKGLLHRLFTQNIDGLEVLAGVPEDLVVEAHGTTRRDALHCTPSHFRSAHCIGASKHPVRDAISRGEPLRCDACGALAKPDIVFFGEALPARFWRLAESDFPSADLLIVLGTSLVVNPFASLVGRVGERVPRLLVNRERVMEVDARLAAAGRPGFVFGEGRYRDALWEGDCDAGCAALADALGWGGELEAATAAVRAEFERRQQGGGGGGMAARLAPAEA